MIIIIIQFKKISTLNQCCSRSCLSQHKVLPKLIRAGFFWNIHRARKNKMRTWKNATCSYITPVSHKVTPLLDWGPGCLIITCTHPIRMQALQIFRTVVLMQQARNNHSTFTTLGRFNRAKLYNKSVEKLCLKKIVIIAASCWTFLL